MNDQELTALAAKAFGNAPPTFSPITDDGDAFRLAVLRGLFYAPEFFHFLALERAAADADYDDRKGYRRAIVRAAAAIGKEMP